MEFAKLSLKRLYEPYRVLQGYSTDELAQQLENSISLTNKTLEGGTKQMSKVIALTANQIAKRICDREDNIYNEKVVKNILNMYMDECRKALLKGERIQLTKIGTIIPEVKTRLSYSLPMCNKEGGNPPYVKFRISRNNHFREDMNRLLMKNIKNGIYGLEKLPFSKQQFNILKDIGYIPEDAEIENGVEE